MHIVFCCCVVVLMHPFFCFNNILFFFSLERSHTHIHQVMTRPAFPRARAVSPYTMTHTQFLTRQKMAYKRWSGRKRAHFSFLFCFSLQEGGGGEQILQQESSATAGRLPSGVVSLGVCVRRATSFIKVCLLARVPMENPLLSPTNDLPTRTHALFHTTQKSACIVNGWAHPSNFLPVAFHRLVSSKVSALSSTFPFLCPFSFFFSRRSTHGFLKWEPCVGWREGKKVASSG